MIINNIHIDECLGDRLDAQQFHPERLSMIRRLKTITCCKLKEVAKNVKIVTTCLSNEDVYIGLENVTCGTGEYIPGIKESISTAAVFKKGDILFSKLRPYLNKVYLAEFSGKSSTEFYILEATNILPEYLAIILRSDIIIAQTKHLVTGNTLPRLQTSDIENLLIPYPSSTFQQKIVDLYTAAQNAKLQKDKEAKELLESIDDIVTQHLGIKLPERSDFSETKYFTPISKLIGQRYDPYFHNPYFEKAFAKLAQSKYPLKKLGDISILITSGITPKAGGDAYTDSQNGIAFIRSGDIDINGNINFEELLYIKPEVHNKQMKSSKVYDNDIMIAIVGATIGQVGIYHSEKEANINQAIALVRLKDGYDPEYVKELIKSSIGQLNLDRLKRPVARANINLEEIASILIPIPEKIEVQTAIAKEIHEIRVKADAIKNEGSLIIDKAKATIEKMILG
ncbi:restriction endonuclease subunit S [Alistipes sp. An66]|uniref:restriction endonuclease subunit S n=1 Tax=Alistipes sp. An66 TaxID=1965650 RepID=UPI000B3A94FD|nr:restriction endonuclease subunit S [Alistipes sp. An66]OUN53602.1 hypothetical protein B5G16_12245 [Alistipes sp. An66]